MKKVLITGGSGLVGKVLSKTLTLKGYEVVFLSRKKNKTSNKNVFQWNLLENSIDSNALIGVNHIVHLAGENIAGKKWTTSQKNKILDSRINSSKLLVQALKRSNHQVESLISASGVGYYGTEFSEKPFTEHDQPGNDFLSKVCIQWESEIKKAQELGIRTVNIRTGLVLSNKGGALPKMTTPIKLGFGATLGNGNQYIPWIHIDDLCALYTQAIENKDWSGPINAVATEYISNKNFTLQAAKQLNKKIWLPNVPTFLLKIIFGEMSTLFLKGNKIHSNKISFNFKFPTLRDALQDLLGNQDRGNNQS